MNPYNMQTPGVAGIVDNVIRYLFKRLSPHKSSVTSVKTPILLSDTSGELFGGAYGNTPDGNYFTYVVQAGELFSDAKTKGMYCVELPFRAGAHIVGVPKNQRLAVKLSAMEPLVLEGDYPNYFTLYVDPDQGSDARYVLDPKAMVFTIDFCQKFAWEILDDTLYFSNTGVLPSFEIVDNFINQIRPAIEIASDRHKNPYKMSYVGTSARIMHCPICREKLIAEDQWMRCEAGHSFLVTGAQLSKLRQDREGVASVDITNLPKAPADVSRQLTCPYCNNPMQASQFGFTPVTIDICTRCMYRWVDSDETTVVFGR